MLPRSLSFLKEHRSPGIRQLTGPDLEFNLMNFKEFENYIPTTPGVYIIVSTDGTHFQYPSGKSPVMYIGMSLNLYNRLKDHYQGTCLVRDRLEDYLYMSYQCHQRYHYFREFGAKVYVFTRRGIQNPKEQEALYIGKFYEKYLSLPVSNGARSFSCK